MFENKDDAERYCGLLEAQDFPCPTAVSIDRDEIDKCEPYFKKQLDIIKPKLIVALGRFAAMSLLKVEDSVSNLRNKIFNYEGIDFLVTYHPSALLRDENLKKFAWEDFKLIRDKYINV